MAKKKIAMKTDTDILVYTSPSTAVLNSVNHGWAHVLINTSKLTKEERELLAQSVVGECAQYSNGINPFDLVPATEAGLTAHLRKRLREMAEVKAEVERRDNEDIAIVRAEIDRLKALSVEELDKETNCNDAVIIEVLKEKEVPSDNYRRCEYILKKVLPGHQFGCYVTMGEIGREDLLEFRRNRKKE